MGELFKLGEFLRRGGISGVFQTTSPPTPPRLKIPPPAWGNSPSWLSREILARPSGSPVVKGDSAGEQEFGGETNLPAGVGWHFAGGMGFFSAGGGHFSSGLGSQDKTITTNVMKKINKDTTARKFSVGLFNSEKLGFA